MTEKVHVTQWEPLPEAQEYAAAIGLTGREFKTTLLELKTRLRTEMGYLGFFDDRFCSFLEARANQSGNGQRRRSNTAPKSKKQQQTDDDVDLSMLDDEDREGFGEFLSGIE